MPEHDENRQMMSEESATTFHRLRRLQEHIRSNIPAMIAQRAGSTFTLQEEPIPDEASDDVVVVVYPQNPFIGQPEVRTMSVSDIRPGLINNRILVKDSSAPSAKPDDDGNYMYWPGTPEFAQVNCFYYINFTLRMYEHYAHRSITWAFPMPRIAVDPHMGEGANAFYSEQDRLIGFHSFTSNGETVNTAHSADIVSHEAAHAVLDGLRDLYNESFGLGPPAFHESFADMSAVLVALHDDSLIRRLLDLTDGNLRLDNFVTAVGEYLTEHLRQQQADHATAHSVYLRNALNTFTAQPFDALRYAPDDPQTQLGRQSHNYSRLFSGAFYDVLVGVYEELAKEMPRHFALHKARDVAGCLLACAVELGPVGEFDFGDMAKAFLTADALHQDGRYQTILTGVFEQRGILTANQAAAHLESLRNLPDVRLPATINNAMASALFLEDAIMPALDLPADFDLTPMAALRNASGYAYLTYFAPRKIELSGGQFGAYDGASIDAFGGLTLMFGPDGRLLSVFVRPVTDEDVRQIHIMTAELIASDLVVSSADSDILPPKNQFAQSNLPRALSLPGFDWSQPDKVQRKLVRVPVMIDSVPQATGQFLDWLRARLKQERPG